MSLSSIRSLMWVDYFIHTLTDPRSLYNSLLRKDSNAFKVSFIIPVFVIISDIVAFSLLSQQTEYFYYKITYGWILFTIIIIIKILILSSFMDLISQFMGFEGKIKEMITIVNFSLFPKLFLLPLIFIFRTINFAPLFFYFFAALLFFVWSGLIIMQSISEMHGVDFGKSLLIFIFPYILFGVAGFFILILIAVNFMGLVFG
jgi:Yip1-like protein